MRTSRSQPEPVAPLGARTAERNQLSLHAHSADWTCVQHVVGGARCGGAGRRFAVGVAGRRHTIATGKAMLR